MSRVGEFDGQSGDLRHRESNTVVEQVELFNTNAVYKATRKRRRFTGLTESEFTHLRGVGELRQKHRQSGASAVDRNVWEGCEKSGNCSHVIEVRVGQDDGIEARKALESRQAEPTVASGIVTSVHQQASMP